MKPWSSLAVFASACAFGPFTYANTIVVNTSADQYGSDTAHCSLREAVRAANTDAVYGGCAAGGGIDLIDLPAGVLNLMRAGRDEDGNSTGDLDIAGDGVVVAGEGAAATIIDGNGLDRIFHTQSGAPALLWLTSLSLRNGDPLGGSSADDIRGGAVFMDSNGALSLTSVHISDSRAAEGGGVFIDSNGPTVSVSGSALSRNSASEYGGAISARREVNISNSTFSGNVSGCVGSAIYFSSSSTQSMLASVTVADNHGGLVSNCIDAPALWNGSPTATVHVRNSIVARNFSGFVEVNCNDLVSDDYNLFGNLEDCDLGGTLTNTLTNVDPQLMPLFDYGNGVPSHMILPGSPAIGGGNPAAPGSGGNACPAKDQRGVDRGDCDIGAYEYRATFTVNRQNDAADATPGNGQCDAVGGGCTLRAAIAEANERDEPTTIVLPAGTYRVSLPYVPNTDSGDLEVEADQAVAIVGAGADRSTVLGDGVDRSLFSLSSAPVALLRLAVRGGHEQSVVRAGGISVHSPALLADLEIAQNQGCYGGLSLTSHVIAERLSIHHNLAEIAGGCPYTGGGVQVGVNGVLEMRNSTISANRAKQGGGGLFVEGGIARLSHVTIADNTADYTGGSAQGGGGIGRGASGTVYLKNSIVADNASGSGVGPDCAALLQSQDFNLVENTADCTIGGETTHNLVGTDPRLTPLGLYGGMLPVHGLRPDSPALDGVGVGQQHDREMACRDGSLRSVATDQRGVVRPEGYFCDIGAFEGSADSIFADGFD